MSANIKSFEWHPVGVDNYRNITQWINLLSYEPLNNNSFRMQMKLIEGNKQILGRLDINCRNKDYYLRKKREMSQRGTWNTIEKGSSYEEIAQIYCKRTSAASSWGYTAGTKYLWDIEKPQYSASKHEGDWITLYKNNSREFKYNSNTQKIYDYILAAYFYQKKESYQYDPYISRKSDYGWIAVSCKDNLYSVFRKLSNSSKGEWMAPKPGPIGGGASLIRKAKCYE
ncbi:hypothetical protein [Prochlorococcus marinus]|uniref:hypothetical protein n=1 Tax=Prochlorococcus TaxID=1218 RepID=UPI00126867FD|nr:hypothetical protein [Prochlorococcus marinus]